MRNRTAFLPDPITTLEDRVALSHAHTVPALVHATANLSTTPVQAPVSLEGTVKGVQTPVAHQPGTLHLVGSGNVAPLGPEKAVGTLTIKSGEPTFYNGTVTLSDPLGSIDVQISGIQGGPIGLGRPVLLHYKITGGTGAFHGATGSGNVTYTTLPSPLANPVAGQSMFRLTFGTPPTPTA
jgi:hypothetical protein